MQQVPCPRSRAPRTAFLAVTDSHGNDAVSWHRMEAPIPESQCIGHIHVLSIVTMDELHHAAWIWNTYMIKEGFVQYPSQCPAFLAGGFPYSFWDTGDCFLSSRTDYRGTGWNLPLLGERKGLRQEQKEAQNVQRWKQSGFTRGPEFPPGPLQNHPNHTRVSLENFMSLFVVILQKSPSLHFYYTTLSLYERVA